MIIFFVVDEDFICKKYTEYIHYTKVMEMIDHSTGVEDYFSQWIQIENVNNIFFEILRKRPNEQSECDWSNLHTS